MAEERGRRGGRRRRAVRDRDRQGDHGGRGHRRRNARQDPGRRRKRRSPRQRPDRRHPGRGRGRLGIRGNGCRPGTTSDAAGRSGGTGSGPSGYPGGSSGADDDATGGGNNVRQHCIPDRARGAARRHGGRDAPRRDCLPDGRGSRRVPGCLQGEPGSSPRSSGRAASSTRRSPSTDLPASAWEPPLAGSGPSSSS